MMSSNQYTYKRGKMGARESRRSELLANDMGYSKPWKRKRRVRVADRDSRSG